MTALGKEPREDPVNQTTDNDSRDAAFQEKPEDEPGDNRDDGKVLFVHFCQHHAHLLSAELLQHYHFYNGNQRTGPAAVIYSSASNRDVYALRVKDVPESRQSLVAHIVDDQIVTLRTLGEIFLCVIDNMIGAERLNQFDISPTAYPGYFGAEGLGDLDGEGAHTSRCTVDQDLLTGLDLPCIA